MTRRRLPPALLALLLVIPLLAGCGFQRQETEEMGFVLALGVDKGRKAGVYNVTAMIALPGKLAGAAEGGGGGGGGESAVMVTTVEAPSVVQAMALIDTYTSRRVNLLHTKGLVVGEDLAREGIAPVVQELTRLREARLDMFLLVARGDASIALAGVKSKLEKDPSRYLELEALSSRTTGYTPVRSQLYDFTTALVDPGRSPVAMILDLHKAPEAGKKPTPPPATDKADPNKPDPKADPKEGSIARSGGDPMELIGTALFHRDRLQSMLTGPETQLMLMASGDLGRTVITVPEPGGAGGNLTLTVSTAQKPKLTARLVGGEAQITETIHLEGDLNVAQSGTNLTTEDQLAKVEQAVSRDLSERLQWMVRRIMATGLDPFGYGGNLARSFPTNDAWEKFRWEAHIAKATVNITVDLRLRRFGMQLAPLTLEGGAS